MEKIEVHHTATSWDDLIRIESELSKADQEWVFRGESRRRTPKTTLQRVCEEFGAKGADVPGLEAKLIRDFQRNYPIYANPPVAGKDDIIYWLSLMRHYGTATRLLDFTYSFFVATFFALENPTEVQNGLEDVEGVVQYEPAAIWAISKTWITKHSVQLMHSIGGIELCEAWGKREASAFEEIFWRQNPPKLTIFPVNPYLFHERLHLQQGLFLCPGSVAVSFEKNLLALPDIRDGVRLILIESNCRREVLWKLHRSGINRELLFPGIDGFARSLCTVTPLSFLEEKRLSQTGGRVPTNSQGDFLWEDYLDKLKRKLD